MSIVRACSYADIWFALGVSILVGVLLFANDAPQWAALAVSLIAQVVMIVGAAIVRAINDRPAQ